MQKSSERRPSRSQSAATDRKFAGRISTAGGLQSAPGSEHGNVGWIGAGTLHFNPLGLRVTARGLTLFGQPRTLCIIRPEEIRAVYREGNAIRFDLLTAQRRWPFDFSATDAAIASEIVELLPTSRTIELEASQRPLIAMGRYWPFSVPTMMVCIAACIGLVAAAVIFRPAERAQVQQTTASTAVAAEDEFSVPLNPDAIAARNDLSGSLPRIAALEAQFSSAFEALQAGTVSQGDFVDGLERWIQPQWRALASRLPAEQKANTPVRGRADDQLKAVIVNWRQALMTYSEGLRTNDPDEVMKAFNYIGAATDQRRSAEALLERLSARL